MVARILYVPTRGEAGKLVEEITVEFPWQGWQTPEQKRANVETLHAGAKALGVTPVLEISTKSPQSLGQRLSPFNLRCGVTVNGRMLETSFESLWNGSKVFEKGGPFPELFELAPWESLKDPRNSRRVNGKILGVHLEEKKYPHLAGYDFLYISAAHPVLTEKDWQTLFNFGGFTEVTLNPDHADTCQAGSVALMVELKRRGLLERVLESFEMFEDLVTCQAPARYAPPAPQKGAQMDLF